MAVNVEVDYGFIKEAVQEVDGLVRRIYWQRRYRIADAFIDTVTPFVPVKSGKLRNSAFITDNGYAVEWSAHSAKGYPYARVQYETPWFNHPRGGSAYWDKEAMFYEGDAFVERCEEILKR